jgi:hypothetical protein
LFVCFVVVVVVLVGDRREGIWKLWISGFWKLCLGLILPSSLCVVVAVVINIR